MNRLRNYPFTLVCVCMVGYLCFLKPPSGGPQPMPGLDKVVHFAMYFGTCSTLWWEYSRCHVRLSARRLAVGAVLLPVLMGGVIELLQLYATTWRGGDVLDFLANTAGVLAAVPLGRYVLWPLYDDGE